MILLHLGIRQTQVFLNRLLGLTSIGTPFSNIRRLGQIDVTVSLQAGTAADLCGAIDRGQPSIVFLLTGDLPYWLDNTAHAVVVVGYDEETVFLNDPQFDDAPKRVRWDNFMLSWSEQDYTYAFIMR